MGLVWHHCYQDPNLGTIGERGNLGVAMFFVLSGFLIVTLLLREKSRTDQIALRSFYARRALRIMPLDYGVVLVSTIVFMGLQAGSPAAQIMRDGLPYLLTYTTNWFFVETFLRSAARCRQRNSSI